VVFALPESRAPGVDVEALALAAVLLPAPILKVVTLQYQPGHADRLSRTQWIAQDGTRSRAQVIVDGHVVEDVLREPGGRLIQYQGLAHRLVIAPSCRTAGAVCTELVDPITIYRERLARGDVTDLENVRYRGRQAYRFTLPVQELGGPTTRVEQVVTVDADNYLPRRIVWREHPAGGGTIVDAVIDVQSIEQLGETDAPAAFTVDVPPGTPIVQLDASGHHPVGRPSIEQLTLAEARDRFPAAWWLGRRYQGLRLSGVSAYSWPAGNALRLDYGPLTVWSFDRVIPPPLLPGRLVPAKVVSLSGVTERFFQAVDGRLVAERDLSAGSVAAVGPRLGKMDLFAALQDVHPLG
jgi:hypothetical protein